MIMSSLNSSNADKQTYWRLKKAGPKLCGPSGRLLVAQPLSH